MITSIVSILIIAVLFTVFGLLRPRVGCHGNCDQCGSCDATKEKHHV